MLEHISSLQNPLVKKIKRLTEKSADRRSENLFVVEGVRECSLMQQAGYEIQTLLICESNYKQQAAYPISPIAQTRTITEEVYQSLALRGSSEGVIALAVPKQHTLATLQMPEIPLILVLYGIEKPGNIGAMLRTCDAAGVDAIFICNLKADVYNPNAIRSSLGTVFTNQIVVCNWSDAMQYFVAHNISRFAAQLGATKNHYACNFNQPAAIVMGAEATGLPADVLALCNEHLIIPMQGKIDSLNVSVSAGILLYEAVRQRGIDY